jgi:hypothetical protein
MEPWTMVVGQRKRCSNAQFNARPVVPMIESSSIGLRFTNRFCEPAAADSFAIHGDVSFVELSTKDR